MIVKKVKNKKTAKPKAWQIGDLVDYIRHPHNKNPQEKIEYAGGRNFLSRTHAGQKMEMITLAGESVHSKMPVRRGRSRPDLRSYNSGGAGRPKLATLRGTHGGLCFRDGR